MRSCPGCGWRPASDAKWRCPACEERYDRFECDAACPRCAWVRPETSCLECGESSPHAAWLEDEAERAAFQAACLDKSGLDAAAVRRVLRLTGRLLVSDVTKLSNAGELYRKEKEAEQPALGKLRAALLDIDDRLENHREHRKDLERWLVDLPHEDITRRRELAAKLEQSKESIDRLLRDRVGVHSACVRAGWVDWSA